MSDPNAPEELLRRAFAANSTLSELLERILDVAVRLAGAEHGFILLTRADGSVYAQVVRNMREKELPQQDTQVSQSIVRRVLALGKSLLVEDAQNSNVVDPTASIVRMALRSVVCAPLMVKNRPMGVIYLENRTLTGIFDERHRQAVEQVAQSVSTHLSTHLNLRGFND